MERKLLDMMNQLSISEYNPRMKYCDKFQFANLPLIWIIEVYITILKTAVLWQIVRQLWK